MTASQNDDFQETRSRNLHTALWICFFMTMLATTVYIYVYSGGLVTVSNSYRISSKTADYNLCLQRRPLVYICDKGYECGGWADRQRGIVSVFLLSQLSNRSFSLILNKPCPVSKFLQPNVYNWSKCANFKPYSKKEAHSTLGQTLEYRIANITNFDALFPEKISYITVCERWLGGIQKHPDVDASGLSWVKNKGHGYVFAKAWKTLFTPQPHLQTEFNDFRNKYRPFHLVCAQVRMGKNPDAPDDDPARMGTPNTTVIFKFLSQFTDVDTYRIYVASDSGMVRKETKLLFGMQAIDAGLKPMHIDQLDSRIAGKTDILCAGVHDVIFDQMLLSSCDTLLVTYSGFGINAAYLRDKDSGLFCYIHESHNIIPCVKNELKLYYRDY